MKRTFMTVAVAVMVLAPLVVYAQVGAGSAMPRAHVGGFYIGAGIMEASGDGGFTISGVDAEQGPFSSVLEFPMDGTYFVIEAGIDEIGSGFGVHLRYGSSDSLEGTTTDTDFLWDITSREYIKSLSQTDGENIFLTLDVTYGVCERTGPTGRPTTLDVFGGYQMQDATFDISDVRTVIANGRPVDFSTSGLAATYDLEFWGIRIGVRGELPVGDSGTITGHVAVLPYVEGEGFGQWLLRQKAFDHDATGWGLDIAVRYEYALSPSVRLWGGVGYTRMKATDGVDRQFHFGGEPIGDARLDEISSENSFVMIGGEFRF